MRRLCRPALRRARPRRLARLRARSAQGDVAVTIYNNDLALVQDTRQLNLPGGPLAPGIPRRLGADPAGDGDA